MKYSTMPIIKKSLLLAVFIIPFVVSCGNGSKKGAAQMRGRQQAQPLPVLQLQKRHILLTTSYPTQLQGAQTVEIRPRVQGYIVSMPVDEGEVVDKGQVLFQLSTSNKKQQVRSAKADVQSAKADVQTAKDDVERIKSLVKQNIVSDYKLKSAEDKLLTKKADLAQANASLKNAQINLGYATVRSPVHGSIGDIPYRVGSLVSSSITNPLTVVSDVSTMYAYFSMSEGQLLDMLKQVNQPGGNETIQQQVADMPEAHLILADSSTYKYKGKLQLASGHIRQGQARLKAIFQNPHDLLRSGSSGEVEIPFALDSVIVVPKSATYEIQAKRFVYTVTDSNTVKSTIIKTRPLSTKKLFVVKQGLSPDDVIVTAGITRLRNGAKIIPQPVNADSLYQVLTVRDQQKAKSDSGKQQ